ncbi:PREDICTED: THO complex subunit 2-like [Tarenaya hassleriana]|uniref:THO complex subunit 2-like n=1 Tax=Tarenaya hassleriana TaxID=28532 RepID=UPI00053C4D76|nr:PREDICTED: THO complex subunit 2-like [Tarenaya hassleriana]
MSLPLLKCKFVTEEFLRECKNGNYGSKLPSSVPMLRFVYELCWTMVRGELPIQNCKAVLQAMNFADKPSKEELGSCFADVVTQIAQDLTMSGDPRGRLIKLAKWLVESKIVPQRLFQERCEEEFLWETAMVKIKAQDLKGKEVRVNTRLLYQQTKFNLLREESEGYAKLVTLLCRGSASSSENTSAATMGIIKSLIGHFDLDLNRVFDIVLDCFELQPDNNLFLDLIPIFPKSHASQILGFKFQFYQRLEVNNPVPFGLYKLTALLVKEEFISLDSIYSHLLPKHEESFEHYNAFSAKRLEEANKIGKINLAATGKDLMEDEKPGDVTVDLFAALDMETEAVAERAPELENNQTLGLLNGFLAVDDWYHAHILFECVAPLNPVAHTQICSGLFKLIEKSISPAYDIVRQTRFQSSISSNGENTVTVDAASSTSNRGSVDFPKEVFQMLSIVGPYLYRDTILLQKICRVLRVYYLSILDLVRGGVGSSNQEGSLFENPRMHMKEVRARIEEALGTCLLPSLQLTPGNPAVGHEIWDVMSLLTYEARYRLYGEWENEGERNPLLLAARQVAKLDTRRILKRLAKENLKQLGRMVAKLAHANPMMVLRTIVHQIEAYRDMINPVVDAFKYLTQLEYDILEYVVIERLAQSGRDKLKDDGLNLSDWLQSLASFWGHLCKKYPSMELRGLFQYLVNQLKRGQGIELVLLQELIQQMANVQYTENLTEDQLDAMAGSETLRYHATSFGMTRNNKALAKSSNRLRDAMLPNDEPKLAIPLLLLIAQHRSVVLINADAPYIKMVSEQFDRCHGTLLQYVEFLTNAVSPASAYARLVPSLEELVHAYHLDPEVAFLIYRPVMRLFKSQQNVAVQWPLDAGESMDVDAENTQYDPQGNCVKVILDVGPSQKAIMWSGLLDTVRTMLPSKAWNSLSPDLYATFWGLTLYDIYVPRNRYESEIAKQHAALKTLEEVADNSSSAITKRKKEKERIQESLDRLTSELCKHEEHVASVHRRLSREKDKWLSSCPDTLKINMEFLQRCIFPRCTFSMADSVYCAKFVHMLHSLGTPFFNTVNHIDVLICKTLQPMICCCTEYEAGRLGRFLFETLKIAYYWKSDESVYEQECGNMPGFAVYYRYPNSQRVTYGQFLKVHWKWSQRITRLLIQCLESNEYMEIRNALLMLTKISSVFPVTRKSGINLEKRVAKIKNDDREDLKVLATGVAAALAARKPSWVTDEEFGMGYLELKAAPAHGPKHDPSQNGSGVSVSQVESTGGRSAATVSLHPEFGGLSEDQGSRSKLVDGRLERTESIPLSKSDRGHINSKGGNVQLSQSKRSREQKETDEMSRISDEHAVKVTSKSSETGLMKRAVPAGSMSKTTKPEFGKEDNKSGKGAGRNSMAEKDLSSHNSESSQAGSMKASSTATANVSIATPSAKVKDNGADASDVPKQPSPTAHSPRLDNISSSKSSDRLQKRTTAVEDTERMGKRRKGDAEHRDYDANPRLSDRARSVDARVVDFDKATTADQNMHREQDRSKEKGSERHARDYRERLERSDKSHGDDVDKIRDKSVDHHGRERSAERGPDRGVTRGYDRNKDDRTKDDRKSHSDDHFHSLGLPPPPPLPPNMVPQSLGGGRRDEDVDRKAGTSRHSQRLSPRIDERERRRSEENSSASMDDTKCRREDDFRDRKRDDREMIAMKGEEREREREAREREKATLLRDEMEASSAMASKSRKIKRGQQHMPSAEPGEYSPPPMGQQSSLYEGKDRKNSMILQHGGGYLEEPGIRLHGKEVMSKMARRDPDPMYDREWEEEKRRKRRDRK